MGQPMFVLFFVLCRILVLYLKKIIIIDINNNEKSRKVTLMLAFLSTKLLKKIKIITRIGTANYELVL